MKKKHGNAEKEYYSAISKQTREISEMEKNTGKVHEPFNTYIDRKEKENLAVGKDLLESLKQSIQLVFDYFDQQKDNASLKEIRKKMLHFASHVSNKQESGLQNGFINDFVGLDKEMIEKIYQAGLHYLNLGDNPAAARVFTFLNLLDPGYSVGWLSLGMALKRLNVWKQSLQALDMSLKIDPSNPLAYYMAAQCYKELGLKKEAKEALKKAHEEARKQHNNELEKAIAHEKSLL